jgi:uncharacterized RDD family membrane protein YckC
LPDLTDSVEFERGGFWRRALALAIDLAAICLVLELATLALFPLTNGRLQFSGGMFAEHCQELASVPEGLSVAAEFGANSITDCRNSLMGLPASRVLSVSRITRDGTVTKVVTIGYLLDAEGKPTRGLPLDVLMLPLLLALRFGFDRRRGSPGRRLCRIRLANGADGEWPPPASAVKRRYVALALPLLPFWTWSAYAALFPGPELAFTSLFWLCSIAAGLPLLIAALQVLDSIIHRRDTYYDRFANTCVLRLDKENSVVAVATAPLRLGANDAHPAGPQTVPEVTPGFALPPPLPQSALRSRNYLVRHWRGELSLPVSYWLNGILGGVAIGVVVSVLVYATRQQGEAQPVLWLASLTTVWIVAVLLTVWQMVGVWRSATRYRQNGERFWGGAAKTMAALGIVQLAANFFLVGTAQIAGIYEIVAGDSRVGVHEFHVVGNGLTLQFSGGITFGVAREFDQFLNAVASIKTVELNSQGGRIQEAQRISDLIKRRGLSTIVVKDCLSACTIVFLGGKQRFMMPDARLGFHQPAFRGMTTADRSDAIATEMRRLQQFGLSKAFAARANEASPGGMWYPDKDELVRERVVTRVITPAKPVILKPADKPVASATPESPAAGGAQAAAPPASPTNTGEAAASATIAGRETGRATLPADLVKRLATPPRKPALFPAPQPPPPVGDLD